MSRRIIAAALIAASLTAPAWAKPPHHHAARQVEAPAAVAEAPHEDSIVLSGIVNRGANVCDAKWIERPGADKLFTTVAKLTERLHQTDAQVVKIMDKGAADFDQHLKEMGAVAACKEVDTLIENLAALN